MSEEASHSVPGSSFKHKDSTGQFGEGAGELQGDRDLEGDRAERLKIMERIRGLRNRDGQN